MKRLDDATIKKAETVFNQARGGRIVTGQGLSRRQLRQLERAGLIESQLMKNKDTGALIYEWKPVSLSAGIIKKA
jgi:hypothetical protein